MRANEILQNWIQRAQSLATDPQRTLQLLQAAKAKFQNARLPSLKELKSDFMTAVALVRSYTKGEYREIPWQSILLMIGGLLYFLSPIDLIPDFIPLKGLVDDVAILAYIFTSIHGDLERFRQWQGAEIQVNANPVIEE